ncbi:glycoside hydrolase family 9 protein [Fibrobacter sp. UWB3]|uniref:glycoside hydrolase family 9 protein n=1 Tax=Fibrobacter sp. UWB3 TaxID=1964357 RepID=UPI000B526BEA|nr:glycoside hydrolase family 9 protein [Fibrobacter sp. UWB3]OWV22910.1 glycoside hydrolase [Fibrobacter sp. UWB3]
MSIIKYLLILFFVVPLAIAQQEQPTPYDLIRPTFPLTWDTTVFDHYDASVTKKKNTVPKIRTTPFYAPNAYIVDTLDQAYLDAINYHMSPIRVNQAGYLESDKERQFYYIGTASTFEIVDVNGKPFSPAITGSLKSSGHTTSSDWTIVAGTNAATNDQMRYKVDITGQSGTIMIGNIPQGLPTDTRLRIKVGNEISSTFIISDQVYTMVKDAAIKFYGINRSGYGDSWFHPSSHTKDGAGAVTVGDATEVRNYYDASMAGTLEGGYYDCGDHLKESQTQMYAFMVAAVMAATNPDVDVDHYKYNHGAGGRDGIPDMLREAKHGADFVLRSFVRAKGVIDDMALSIGAKGSDHGWWGRPENQDGIPVDGSPSATDRGGPSSRMVRLGEIGSNIGGETAAGLAILGKMFKDYSEYEDFADSCLMVAEKMYSLAKAIAQGKSTYDGDKPIKNNTSAASWSSQAYNGNNEFYDDLALASVALLYATGDKQYADDMIRTRKLVPAGVKIGDKGQTAPTQEYMENCAGCFEGGWFVTNDKGFLKNVKSTSWANSYTFALYALYKLILADKNKAITQYGLTEDEWLNAVEDCVANLIYNVSDMSEGAGASIELPMGSIIWKQNKVTYDADWYNMASPSGDWIYNRYQAGNIFDVMAYVDVAKSIKAQGITLPHMGTPNWKTDEMQQLAINQMNYMLGVNPWDISFIYGVGDKNDAHPHHRASNPEGTNVPGGHYPYKVPTGAFLGGIKPGGANSFVPKTMSWEDYEKSEVCIDASATFLGAVSLVAHKFDMTQAPDISVEIRHKSADSAIVTVNLTIRGTAVIHYGTTEGEYSLTATDNLKGVQHDIVLRNLTPGTTYYFYVTGANAYKPENEKPKYLVDSTQTPYSFTTLSSVESAEITNVTVCNVSADSAEIMWYTPNGEYESRIYWDIQPHSTAAEYAYNTGAGNADVSGIPTQFHYVKIGELKEKTTYYFMVESNGTFANVDDDGKPLKFTTPVTWYDFSVKTYQYPWQVDMAMVNINIFNNESRAFDSLTIRLYMRGTDEIENDIGMGTDICNDYDEAGFSGSCPEETIEELARLLRDAHPVKIEDTYDDATGTWQWYFPLNLGSTVIKSSSRLRFDVRFDHRSPYPPYKDLMNEAPNKKLYCYSGNKWYAPSNETPGAPTLDENPGDWSWMPHSRANGEELDYPGMPCIEKDEGDKDFDAAPVNPYVSVYRKDEFIWGYSPSKKEMQTKRANYKINMVLDPPFNVSNGSHIDIDQTSSTVHVTGKAHISEGGYITKIWANGVKVSGVPYVDGLNKWILDESGTKIIAKYDIPTDMWDLDIPVKMSIGSKKVDITLFAGPDPTCDACLENGGCAFENRSYYVNFSKGDATESQLVIKDALVNGNPIISPANPEGTTFYIDVMDKDKIKSNTKTIDVQIINSKRNDELTVTLKADAANPGHFTCGPITAVNHSKETRNQTSEISFFAGDTIQVVYTDPDDEDDISKQSFYAISKIPSPQKVLAEDTDCDNKADQLRIIFSNKITEGYTLDSIKYFIEGMTDSIKVPLTASKYADLNEVTIPIDTSLIPTDATPSGKITTYIADKGTPNAETTKITDGILPTLVSVSILEKSDNDNNDLDTVLITFSEPVILSSQSEWPLSISGAAGVPTVIGKGTTTNNGRSWQFIISGNKDNTLVPIGALASARTTGGYSITDQSFNPIDPTGCKPTVPVTLISRPVPVYHAEMIDIQGDGIPDKIYIMFESKLKTKDMFDSIVTSWGNPGITRSFITTADTTGGVIKPKESYWTIRDSVSAPFSVQIDSVTKKDSVNTYSIIEINIPENKAYPIGSTSGENDGNGTISPHKGITNGFFETTYTLYDKCPPIITSARLVSGLLTVNISESVNILETGKYIQRERDEYIPSEKPQGYGKSYLFTYNEKDNVFHAGDRVRLVPDILGSAFIDKNGIAPTISNPYVRITGNDKIRFNVTLTKPVSKPKAEAYIGRPETIANESFVTSAVINGKHNFINGDGSVLGQVDTAAYFSSGPNFEIEVMMPSASFTTHEGLPMYDFRLKVVMDLYDNLGQYINTYKLDIPKEKFAEMRNLINNGLFKLSLEWAAKDNEAPVAKKGNKIGTGAYIAKFDLTAESFCATNFDKSSNDYKLSCEKAGIKAEKASDSKTKTFGFKRKM